MDPIKTENSNDVYRGPTEDIGDLHVRRERPNEVYSVWQPSAEERERIAQGANIELGIFYEPIPPVSLLVTDEQRVADAN